MRTMIGLLVFFGFCNIGIAHTKINFPDIAAIAKVNFDYVEYNDVFNKWYVMQRSHVYDQSNLKWDFGIIVDAKNREDAIAKGKQAITELRNPSAPNYNGGYYMCEYTRKTGTEGIAFYPAGNPQNINYLLSTAS
jgi:hypothetical protein